MPDSVMLNSYFMLYLIPLYHFPLYLIPDCPLERYNRFLFSVIPDSIMPDSVIPDSCFDIPDSVIPNSIIPDSCFACYNRFCYTRFPAPIWIIPLGWWAAAIVWFTQPFYQSDASPFSNLSLLSYIHMYFGQAADPECIKMSPISAAAHRG